MIAALTPEREELAQLVRRFLTERAPLSDTRRFLDGGGYDTAVWDQMGKELGLQGLVVPEEHGGMGCGLPELALVVEELGRPLYSGPFFSTVCLALPAVLASQDEERMAALLPGIATGSTSAALAFAEPQGIWDGSTATTTWTSSDGYRLSGTKTLVVDGDSADLVLVTAASPDDPTSLSLFAVQSPAEGLVRRRLPALDQTRSLSSLHFESTPAELVGSIGDGARILRSTLDQAAILLAAEQLGGAQRCLDMAVEYAGIRTQFGRAIGSFQAIKHRCADMLLEVETARSAVMLAVGDPSAANSHLVRAHVSEVFSRAATSNVQIHGGIGFTWEHDAHLYLKRAKSSEALLGSPSEHRELLAQLVF